MTDFEVMPVGSRELLHRMHNAIERMTGSIFDPPIGNNVFSTCGINENVTHIVGGVMESYREIFPAKERK